jgi:membrane protease YdiL (CAAX protease family)
MGVGAGDRLARMRDPDPQERPPENRRPFWLLCLLAAFPFSARWLTDLFGLPIHVGQVSYKLLLLVAPLWWRRRFEGRGWLACLWPVDEPRPNAKTWLLAVASAAVLAGGAIFLIPILAEPLGIQRDALRMQFDLRFELTPVRAAIVVAYLFTINAALEELHYRAWLDRELSARFGNAIGIVASAVVFSALHMFIFAPMEGVTLPVLALIGVALFIAGSVWSLLARHPGGIHAAWLSHGLTDAGLLTWALFWLRYY